MAAKRKPNSWPVDLHRAEALGVNGCIDARTGRVIEGFFIRYGEVWIPRSELAKAVAWGWRPIGVERKGLVVVRRPDPQSR